MSSDDRLAHFNFAIREHVPGAAPPNTHDEPESRRRLVRVIEKHDDLVEVQR